MVNKRCTYDDGMQVVIDTNEGKRTVGLLPTDLFSLFRMVIRQIRKRQSQLPLF